MSFAIPLVPTTPYVVYLGSTSSGTVDSASFNFSAASLDLGAYSADRIVVIGVGTRDTGAAGDTPISVAVAGSSATEYAQTLSGSVSVSFWVVRVTQTSGVVEVTFPDTADHCVIFRFAVYGCASATPYDTSVNTTGADPRTLATMAVPENGVCIGMAAAITTTGFTVTGDLTEVGDVNLETMRYCAAITKLGSTERGPATSALSATFDTDTSAIAAGISFR